MSSEPQGADAPASSASRTKRLSRKSWQRPSSTCGRSSTTLPGYGPRSATGIASPSLARPALNRERSSTTRSSARRRHSRRWAATSSQEAGLG